MNKSEILKQIDLRINVPQTLFNIKVVNKLLKIRCKLLHKDKLTDFDLNLLEDEGIYVEY